MRSAPTLANAALAVLALPAPARGSAQQGDVAAAADAYSRAQQAELREDFAQAAQLYALADEIAPAAEALRSAARAALRAGLDATAATHAARLQRREADPESQALAQEILSETRDDLARIDAHCVPACRVLVDGRMVAAAEATSHVVYARPGRRRIGASFEGSPPSDERPLTLHAGATVAIDLAPAAPPTAPVASVALRPEAPGGGGLTPWVFAASAALTAVAGGVLIWSGVDVLEAHSRYRPTAPGADADFAAGQQLELRTNVLIAVTGGLALTSLVLAIVTDWGGDSDARDEARGAPLLVASGSGVVAGWIGSIE